MRGAERRNLEDCATLARQCAFLGAEGCGFQGKDAAVRRNLVADAQLESEEGKRRVRE